MKRTMAIGLLLGLILAGLAAQDNPKIAVLDCTIPKGFDSTVIIPITENIMEELVNSFKYKVLDRANISAIFKEKEFQLTGEVTDKDIAAAGQLLGANFVVVTKMQQVGDTYFLTSKMINITTGEISAQASVSQEGKLTVLLSMAHTVGWALATGQKIVQPAPGTLTTGPSPSPNGKPAAPGTKPAASPSPVAAMRPGTLNLVQQAMSSPAPLVLAKGQLLYTQVGLHPDARNHSLSSVNYLLNGDYLPPGTAVEVVAFDRNTLKFKKSGGKDIYDYEDHKQSAEPFLVHLARFFSTTWNPTTISAVPKLDQEGIAQGKALVGMTRDGVILAIGYPPRLENKDINAAKWVYWVSRMGKIGVNFDANGVVTLVK